MLRLLAAMIALLFLVACSQTPSTQRPPLVLRYREQSIAIGAAIEPLLAALGEDYTVEEAASCAGIGKDYVYTYPSLRLYVFAPEGGAAVVTSACYTDDGAAYQTLTIGSAAETVTSVMGTPDEQSASRLVYRAEGVTLTFSLREGVVTAMVLSEE